MDGVKYKHEGNGEEMADALTQKVHFRFVDNVGKTGTSGLWFPLDTTQDAESYATQALAFQACSNCNLFDTLVDYANNGDVGSASSNAYDVRDKLAVEYVDSQNGMHTIHVPDPSPSIFQSSNMELVDPTNTDWLAAVTAIEANVVDKAGNSVVVLRGYRTRSRKLKTSMRFQ
jgi:hypothetical protein